MWLVFMLAALLMLVGGVGGSIVLEKQLLAVPQEITDNLEFIKNVVTAGGIGLSLLGISLCYRKLRWVGRRRGGAGRSGRTRAIDFPRRESDEDAQGAAGGDGAPESEKPTLLFADGPEAEPGTQKMRRIGR